MSEDHVFPPGNFESPKVEFCIESTVWMQPSHNNLGHPQISLRNRMKIASSQRRMRFWFCWETIFRGTQPLSKYLLGWSGMSDPYTLGWIPPVNRWNKPTYYPSIRFGSWLLFFQSDLILPILCHEICMSIPSIWYPKIAMRRRHQLRSNDSNFWEFLGFSRWLQLKYFLFSPRTLGKRWSPIWLAHIFQMGWWKTTN